MRFVALIFVALIFSLWAVSASAQEEVTENPTTGTIQGTVRDDAGNPVEGARVLYRSRATETRGVTRTGKDGKYVSEPVVVGAAVPADFKLEWINPGPLRLESTFSGDAPESLPINGRNYLNAGQLEPGVQAVDGAILDPGKSAIQTLSINSQLGRTTHYDFDEVEVMDETRGAAELNLPAEAVREVVISRATPELFQSLNATGAVRVTTRSGAEEWHGNLFGNFRDQVFGLAGFPSGNNDYSRQQYGFGAGGGVINDKAFLFVAGERTKQDGLLPISTADRSEGRRV